MVKKSMRKFLLWLLSCIAEPEISQPAPIEPVLPDWAILAGKKVLEQEAVQGVSGEWKRHQCFAQLKKAFPDVKARDLGLAIELAVQRLL